MKPTPPSYGMKLKPKKKPIPGYKPGGPGRAVFSKKKPIPKAPAVTTPPTPAQGPVAGPPPPGIGGPAPPSLQGESNRIDVTQDYGTTLSGVNNQLMQAALRYGGAPQVQQFGYDPTGGDTSSLIGVTTNPDDNSALSTIARTQAQQAKGIDQGQNAQNTFFSSNRLDALGQNDADAGRQRLQAKAEFDNAISELINQLMGARNARDTGIREAGITDIQAAESVAPPAAVPVPARSPTPKPKPKPKLKKKPKR